MTLHKISFDLDEVKSVLNTKLTVFVDKHHQRQNCYGKCWRNDGPLQGEFMVRVRNNAITNNCYTYVAETDPDKHSLIGLLRDTGVHYVLEAV